jgi:hypothetical protein
MLIFFSPHTQHSAAFGTTTACGSGLTPATVAAGPGVLVATLATGANGALVATVNVPDAAAMALPAGSVRKFAVCWSPGSTAVYVKIKNCHFAIPFLSSSGRTNNDNSNAYLKSC